MLSLVVSMLYQLQLSSLSEDTLCSCHNQHLRETVSRLFTTSVTIRMYRTPKLFLRSYKLYILLLNVQLHVSNACNYNEIPHRHFTWRQMNLSIQAVFEGKCLLFYAQKLVLQQSRQAILSIFELSSCKVFMYCTIYVVLKLRVKYNY